MSKDIHITVKIPNGESVQWLPAPKKTGNSENYVGLSGRTAQDGVDQILHSIILSNPLVLDLSAKKEALLGQMIHGMRAQALELPGGLHFIGDGLHIYPGIGNDLHAWSLAAEKLAKHQPPWMGIDRKSTFYTEDGFCTIADHALSGQNTDVAVVVYTFEDLKASLKHLENDFEEFTERKLKKRLEELVPEYANKFCMEFKTRYGLAAPARK